MLTHRTSSAQKSPTTPLDSTQRLAKAKALDLEIKELHRRRNKDRVLLVTRLAALKEARGYLSLGFPSVQAYAKSRLGWGAGKVRALLSLSTRLPQRPLLREAFEAGELDWTKAVLACRATEHEPEREAEREAEWLRAAGELSSRQLEAKVAEASGVSEEERRSPWTFELNALERATIEAGLTALRSEGLGLELGAALAELVRRSLQGGSAGSSRVRFLLDQCTDCGKTTHPTADGDVSVSSAVADRLRCDSETHDVRVKPARVSSTIPPSVKNAVLARSKGICEFPGCGLRAWLEVHHGRGRGKGHDMDWLFHFCAGHHKAPLKGQCESKALGARGCASLGQTES